MLPDLLSAGFALAPVWPALAAIVIAFLMLPGRPSERIVARVTIAAVWLSLVSAACGVLLCLSHGPVDYRLGNWYEAAEYSFPLVMLFDGLSAAMSAFIAVIVLTTAKFSVTYLHREPGFVRFFVLTLFFAAGMQLLVLAGSAELLFIGWEFVGISSVLLVAFFHERAMPVQAALRVLVTYRVCDIGLLLGAVGLHHWLGTTVWADVFASLPQHTGETAGLAVGLALVFAAMGKSAQFPVGGWLPRAMEGPTASSAVFYGSLSVHAGVYLLLRAAPILEQSLITRTVLVVVGLVTAVIAALSSQVSADAKSAVAHATASQVGLMFVECGLGFYTLALVHLITHATLRYYQFLRTLSAVQDAMWQQAALGRTDSDEAAARWEEVAPGPRRAIYRLALERFAVEPALDRWLTRPIMNLSRLLDRLEGGLLALHGRTPEAGTGAPLPLMAPDLSADTPAPVLSPALRADAGAPEARV
ncbi:proton-conducting transporter transmembrane domain-containing protein [Nannocystis radixulma]|uniref:Proton-conducting transporter membrane subunit n=1 Tax=Nannocystis radixulma TaxID=2995305 RepID=A0ABT5B7E2_9BACT|nr:proton-conducting transporter membrane subunit [Nannocystis radixulma]MDC0669383.1 proton-conducting transporter membrane subunit [Nannocystis radixulma]